MIGRTLDNQILANVLEIEHHLHNLEKWFGAAAAASGETHIADRMDGAISPFALLSGNSDFGSWVQLLGSSDLPVRAGMTMADAHRIMVTTVDSTNPFIVQVMVGESADFAANLLAENFTEFPYIAATNNSDSGVTDIKAQRITAGTKAWGRCACIGQDAKTINFYVGIHEYLK